jgi:hypothetical protein
MKPAHKKFSISDLLEEGEDTLSLLKHKVASPAGPAFLYQP